MELLAPPIEELSKQEHGERELNGEAAIIRDEDGHGRLGGGQSAPNVGEPPHGPMRPHDLSTARTRVFNTSRHVPPIPATLR